MPSRAPAFDQLERARERRPRVTTGEDLAHHVLVLLFERQREDGGPDCLEDILGRLREAAERQTRTLRLRRHGDGAGYEHLVTGPHARPGERDERTEVARAPGGGEKDAHEWVTPETGRIFPEGVARFPAGNERVVT
jgi:hypothetical protein